jgi:hypothetical protein
LLLFSTVPVSSAASSNSPSNRSIKDFRFLFPINPATALLQPHQAIPHRVEALKASISPFQSTPRWHSEFISPQPPLQSETDGGIAWISAHFPPINSELHFQRPHPVAAPRWWAIPPDLCWLPVSFPAIRRIS